MRRAIVLLACAATVLAGAGEARATNECRGLMVCVPVAGPWVIVPATRHVQYQVACPRSYIIGGLDAELSHRAIDVTFPGRLGSPVNPGHHDVDLRRLRRLLHGRHAPGDVVPPAHRMHPRFRRRW